MAESKKKTQTATRKKTASRSGSRGKAAGRNNTAANRKKAAANSNGWLLDEIILWMILALCIFMLISNFGIGGYLGNTISSFFFGMFGFPNYLFPFVLFIIAAFLISNSDKKIAWIKALSMILLLMLVCGIVELICNGFLQSAKLMDYYQFSAAYKTGGGLVGGLLCKLFCPALGLAGTYVVYIILTIICVIVITERSFLKGIKKSGNKVYHSARKDAEHRREMAAIRREQQDLERKKELEERREQLKRDQDIEEVLPSEPRLNHKISGVSLNTVLEGAKSLRKNKAGDMHEVILEKEDNHLDPDFKIEGAQLEPLEAQNPVEEPYVEELEPDVADEPPQNKKNPKSSKQEQEAVMSDVAKEIEQSAQVEKPKYVYPPIKLLKKPSNGRNGDSNREIRDTARKLQQTLHNFGVEVTISNVSCGPSVTRYELTPEQGVKVSRIVNLADDIKLNLAAADIRIEAPIPGKSAVGIEVPNRENSAVMLRELLESPEFKKHSSSLAFAAGKDIGGKVVVTDIARMPHLLIAGATGSGKSVCINTIIMSILYKAKPEDVKLIMIDPKVVELSVYNGIPHLFIPVVTDPKKAAGALNWGVAEMDSRYKKFAELNVRDLKGYNKKIATIENIEDESKPEKLPQIVIIVDELADLMMVAPGEVEDSICRLAQLARAAGIHLIIATQRPSVNVITGLIKANMPSRIAFSVSSGVDSRTILDMHGAEKLLGKGDMLFYPQGYQKPARVQGAFVSDSEVGAVVEFLKQENTETQYQPEIEEQINRGVQAVAETGSGAERDAHFAEAGKFIIEKDKASIGMLQRVFKIGFNRAARIMDQLAAAGVVGEEEGTKPRKVLMSSEEFEKYLEEYV